MSNTPPFADAAAYALALVGLVKDAKSDRTDEDFVADGLEAYSDHYPAWNTADIGDDATKEWQLGKTGEPFADFPLGYADLFPIEVEELDSDGAPYNPRSDVVRGWRIDERVVAGTPVKFLMFESAPASTSKYRVRWREEWAAAAVPRAHQMSVVYFAAHAKCLALVSRYRSTVDAGSDIFDGDGVAIGYRSDARKWLSKAMAKLGIGARKIVVRGRVKRSRRRVFNRGMP